MSTGLVYPPGAYAVTDEIVAVGEALSPVGGLYASHIRNENDDLAEALHEAIEIGAGSASRSRCPTSRPPDGRTTAVPRRRSRSSIVPAPPGGASTTTPTRTRPAARS